MAAARFFSTERGARHQAADGHEGSNAAAIGTERSRPFVERLDGGFQQRLLTPQAD